MSITVEMANEHKNDPAVLCCRREAGQVLAAADFEDPTLFDDYVASGLLEIPDNTLKIGDHTFRLMHYPISSWDGLNKGYMHLHGHCHLPTHMRFGKGQRMDVGMDGHPEFRPYNVLREVVPLLIKRERLSEMPNDHHTDELKGVVG